MLDFLIQAIGTLTLAAFAGGLLVSLFVLLRNSKWDPVRSQRYRRVRAFLFELSLGSFVVVILLTLFTFMLRAIHHP